MQNQEGEVTFAISIAIKPTLGSGRSSSHRGNGMPSTSVLKYACRQDKTTLLQIVDFMLVSSQHETKGGSPWLDAAFQICTRVCGPTRVLRYFAGHLLLASCSRQVCHPPIKPGDHLPQNIFVIHRAAAHARCFL